MKFPTFFNQTQPRPILVQEKPSMTDQDKKQECDLNFIIQNYVRQGKELPYAHAQYGDISRLSLKDYQDAMLLTAEMKSNFEELPAKEREKFHNNVSEYVDYISNYNNLRDCLDRKLIDIESVPGDVLDILYSTESLQANQQSMDDIKIQSDVSQIPQNEQNQSSQ